MKKWWRHTETFPNNYSLLIIRMRAWNEIHKYLGQLSILIGREGITWGCYNGWYNTSKKCWNMGLWHASLHLCLYFVLHSYLYWSRAMAGTIVPHHMLRATPWRFMAGGVLCWKKSLNNYWNRILKLLSNSNPWSSWRVLLETIRLPCEPYRGHIFRAFLTLYIFQISVDGWKFCDR